MENKEPEQQWWQPGITLAIQISGWIAGPIIIAIFLGKWLDKKYGTDPWLFLACVGASFIISNIGIVRETMKTMKQIDKQDLKNKEIDNKN